jgi:hypothetical protein
MPSQTVEERLAALEAEVDLLKRQRSTSAEPKTPWWEQRWGAFKDDPLYDEAMRLGAEYRKAQPKPKDGDVPA